MSKNPSRTVENTPWILPTVFRGVWAEPEGAAAGAAGYCHIIKTVRTCSLGLYLLSYEMSGPLPTQLCSGEPQDPEMWAEAIISTKTDRPTDIRSESSITEPTHARTLEAQRLARRVRETWRARRMTTCA